MLRMLGFRRASGGTFSYVDFETFRTHVPTKGLLLPMRGRGQPRMGKSSPFVGTWVLNVSKSTYENVPPEARRKPSIRNIDVEGDGTFSESHRNKTGGGSEGYFHWHGVPGGPAEI